MRPFLRALLTLVAATPFLALLYGLFLSGRPDEALIFFPAAGVAVMTAVPLSIALAVAPPTRNAPIPGDEGRIIVCAVLIVVALVIPFIAFKLL
jgi:hypothetical protein